VWGLLLEEFLAIYHPDPGAPGAIEPGTVGTDEDGPMILEAIIPACDNPAIAVLIPPIVPDHAATLP
jgi:hypothetical protein